MYAKCHIIVISCYETIIQQHFTLLLKEKDAGGKKMNFFKLVGKINSGNLNSCFNRCEILKRRVCNTDTLVTILKSLFKIQNNAWNT